MAVTIRRNWDLRVNRAQNIDQSLGFTDAIGLVDSAETLDTNANNWALSFTDNLNMVDSSVPIDLPTNTPAAPPFTQTLINAAMTEVRSWRVGSSNLTGPSFEFEEGWDATGTQEACLAMGYLALVAFYKPTATSTANGMLVTNQVATSITTFLSAGKEPKVSGLYGWTQPIAAATLALGKATPAVWNQLSSDTKLRADWMMRTFAVVGNMVHNAAHWATTLDISLTRDGGFMPNQRGYLAGMNYALLYFGGAATVNALLAAFNFQDYINKFNEFGWAKNRQAWTGLTQTRQLMEGSLTLYTHSPTGAVMRSTSLGVKRPFTLKTVAINPANGARFDSAEIAYVPYDLFKAEECGFGYGNNITNTAYTTMPSWVTCCPNVTGHINGPGSTMVGQLGMCYEFADSSVGRSSLHYTVSANRGAIQHWATLVALGAWPATTDGDSTKAWARRANEHLYYEAAVQGWVCADCQGRCNAALTEANSQLNWKSGYRYGKEIYTVMFRSG